MTRIKIHISNVKLPFYPPCEVKCRLQNRVSTEGIVGSGPAIKGEWNTRQDEKKKRERDDVGRKDLQKKKKRGDEVKKKRKECQNYQEWGLQV